MTPTTKTWIERLIILLIGIVIGYFIPEMGGTPAL